MKVFKTVCKTLNAVIMFVLSALALLMIVPQLMGGRNLAVLSGSMEPVIPVGSLVTVRPVEFEELKEGDVITFQISETTLVTHRIVSIDKEQQLITTKGDANNVEDANPVPFSNVIGKKLFHLPYLGYAVMNIKSPIGIAAICGIVIVLILLNFLPDVIGGSDEKEAKKEEEKQEDKESK